MDPDLFGNLSRIVENLISKRIEIEGNLHEITRGLENEDEAIFFMIV